MGRVFDMRTELKGLPQDLLDRYSELRDILDQPDIPAPPLLSNDRSRPVSIDLHEIAHKFETLQDQIREIEGFRYFGRLLSAEEMQNQAKSNFGDIVVLNVNALRSDAFIVTESRISSVPLSSCQYDEALTQVEKFMASIKELTRNVDGNCC
jgi:hypothetical protein